MIEAELVSHQLLPLCLLGASMKLRKEILAWLLKLCGVVKTRLLMKKNLVKVDWLIDLEQTFRVPRGGPYDTRYKKYSLDKTLLPFSLFSYYRANKNPWSFFALLPDTKHEGSSLGFSVACSHYKYQRPPDEIARGRSSSFRIDYR